MKRLKNLQLHPNKYKFLALPCAPILCETDPRWKGYRMLRFHITCLWCRLRRIWLGKWTAPTRWVKLDLPWSFIESGESFTLLIDPRGRFKMLRCSAILVLMKIAFAIFTRTAALSGKAKKTVRRILFWSILNLMEFLANYP